MNPLTVYRCWAMIALLRLSASAADSTELVEIQSISPEIRVALPYATKDNFLGVAIYQVNKCFLRRAVAEKLAAVQADLAQSHLGLKIWDGYRPLSVQKRLWELVPDERYVASPEKGSRHNRGAAVDVTLVDHSGQELEMPTKFDDFSPRAGAYDLQHTPQALANRKLLQTVMLAHGFTILRSEWWHFDSSDWKNYELLDIPIEQLIKP